MIVLKVEQENVAQDWIESQLIQTVNNGNNVWSTHTINPPLLRRRG